MANGFAAIMVRDSSFRPFTLPCATFNTFTPPSAVAELGGQSVSALVCPYIEPVRKLGRQGLEGAGGKRGLVKAAENPVLPEIGLL